MPVLFAEDALLNYALSEGPLSPEDLTAVGSASQVGPAPLRWGLRVDVLIARGRLKETEVQRIATLLTSRELATAMEPTLDGSQAPPPAVPANPPPGVAPPSPEVEPGLGPR